ncbi:transglycosylase SLT domain-containing protein [Streptomyces yunnanensis]|uniref:Transglycosylase SLT domain-containing protein n=1 Tax=Streptomyces yunnanensis TaxID=156453 RepID=A0ABY8A1B4_9ACTN|nr:transglycosylase SLT domain-containing protein [Streptomyces yunnanensis]WEB38737.1 transglycosylase SLT domain-containing protein [Streptomyces yunnanensis]
MQVSAQRTAFRKTVISTTATTALLGTAAVAAALPAHKPKPEAEDAPHLAAFTAPGHDLEHSISHQADKQQAEGHKQKSKPKPKPPHRLYQRHKVQPKTQHAPIVQSYPNNLDGWIRQAQATLKAHGIPAPTYNGFYRNIMRESSGNPRAINLTDSNAAAGHPSKGLLQAIDSTFRAYHVAGTSWDVYDPVANLCACANYAYHVYGGLDNVNGPY